MLLQEDHDGLYGSPEQTDLHTYYLSFNQVHCSKIFV